MHIDYRLYSCEVITYITYITPTHWFYLDFLKVFLLSSCYLIAYSNKADVSKHWFI